PLWPLPGALRLGRRRPGRPPGRDDDAEPRSGLGTGGSLASGARTRGRSGVGALAVVGRGALAGLALATALAHRCLLDGDGGCGPYPIVPQLRGGADRRVAVRWSAPPTGAFCGPLGAAHGRVPRTAGRRPRASSADGWAAAHLAPAAARPYGGEHASRLR